MVKTMFSPGMVEFLDSPKDLIDLDATSTSIKRGLPETLAKIILFVVLVFSVPVLALLIFVTGLRPKVAEGEKSEEVCRNADLRLRQQAKIDRQKVAREAAGWLWLFFGSGLAFFGALLDWLLNSLLGLQIVAVLLSAIVAGFLADKSKRHWIMLVWLVLALLVAPSLPQ